MIINLKLFTKSEQLLHYGLLPFTFNNKYLKKAFLVLAGKPE